jgi:hypothetical protein
MMQGLSAEERATAIIDTRLPGECLTAAYSDNTRRPYEGIRYDDLATN